MAVLIWLYVLHSMTVGQKDIVKNPLAMAGGIGRSHHGSMPVPRLCGFRIRSIVYATEYCIASQTKSNNNIHESSLAILKPAQIYG